MRARRLRQTLFTQHLQALQISDSYREADTELPLLKKKKKNQRSDIKAASPSIAVKNINEMNEGIHTHQKDQIHQSIRLVIYASGSHGFKEMCTHTFSRSLNEKQKSLK